MNRDETPTQKLLESLQERAKELSCLYRVDEILSRPDVPDDVLFRDLVETLPPGWQYPDVCRARLTLEDRVYQPEGFTETPWSMSAGIRLQEQRLGEIQVVYREPWPGFEGDPFLPEERRLIRAIAERISFHLLQRKLQAERESWERTIEDLSSKQEVDSWRLLVRFLERTDPRLLRRITRKMIHHLLWKGVTEAEPLLEEQLQASDADPAPGDSNQPIRRRDPGSFSLLSGRTFDMASRYLEEQDIVDHIQLWINEENSSFLIEALEDPASGLAELSEAVARHQNANIDERGLSRAVRISLVVGLITRFLVEQPDFVAVAKKHLKIRDFYGLVNRLIYPSRSRGKIGGKGAGLFLAAQILQKAAEAKPGRDCGQLKVPKTWYVASDAILDFVQYNELKDVYNVKYMDLDHIRRDYPYTIQIFKNSKFTPELAKGLAAALDDFGDRPLIVRSSSILEDRIGASFSGKYKSLFLGNRGPREKRLEALMDAVAEIYASVFGPDPIQYRAERGLLDFREEMGILIQEVVGTRVGHYFLPAFAGVAFSNNEFRWSPRIRREDGLVRMVAGLGTRAVDRMSNDYPVLVCPGQPNLRVNQGADEVVRYAPRQIDVINLETNTFETVSLRDFLREFGPEYPEGRRIVSMVDGDRVREPSGLEPDWKRDELVVTMEGIITRTDLIPRLWRVMDLLRETMGSPVDLEFACDGEDLYILQCRSQSATGTNAPSAIPPDLPRDRVVFTANRFVSDGAVPELTYAVYVDPEAYAGLPDTRSLKEVARVIGRLNDVLPRRRFILMGPGRWGSRGDIRLGVSVTYADISNTAALIEISRRQREFTPELSFGTHFFQDLVESGIRYLPLYPDDPGVVFRESFFTGSPNVLADLLPEFAHMAETVRVIDVAAVSAGQVLRVLMNAEQERAIGFLAEPRRRGGRGADGRRERG